MFSCLKKGPTLSLSKGFTLIEMIIVMAILGILFTIVLVNVTSARERARDASKKGGLHALRIALNLYQNNYGGFPATGDGTTFNACGAGGTSPCPVCSTADFTAGGAAGCDVTYMKSLPRDGSNFAFRYYPCDSGDSYRALVTLENASDPELATSQTRCLAATCGLTYTANDYIVCP